jgi:hypothetical protein
MCAEPVEAGPSTSSGRKRDELNARVTQQRPHLGAKVLAREFGGQR